MITKAAFLVFRDNQGSRELLFTRSKGRPFFIFPGGKQEANETIEQALHRELNEELGAHPNNVRKLGVVVGQTPDGRDLTMHLFTGTIEGAYSPHAEVEELLWMDKRYIEGNAEKLTPMALDHVLPFLTTIKMW